MSKPRAQTNKSRRSGPSSRLTSAGPVDFGPLLPFLRERVGDDHPLTTAARDSNVRAFMVALRDSGDAELNHEIACQLERTPLQQA